MYRWMDRWIAVKVCFSCPDWSVDNFSCCKLTAVIYSNSLDIHLLLSCYDGILIVPIGICVFYYHVCW